MFLVPDLPPPAYEMKLAAIPAPPADFILASTSTHLKTVKQCAAHQHFVKGVCTPYFEELWLSPDQPKPQPAAPAKA